MGLTPYRLKVTDRVRNMFGDKEGLVREVIAGDMSGYPRVKVEWETGAIETMEMGYLEKLPREKVTP